MRMIRLLTLGAPFVFASSAFAGPAGDAATQHFNAIAAGNGPGINALYTDKSQLEWVGGSLDGAYVGASQISPVWAKFTTAFGAGSVVVKDLVESANPKGVTVTANVAFSGKTSVKVRYVMVFREDKLVDEIWQIDPTATY